MIAGRYTLEREIGRGGAGVVHLAHDAVLGREVAIKRMGLLPGTTEDDVVRAEREARLAAGISHPHVVAILDLVKDDDCYWLVMEHVVGRTLTELIVDEGPLDPTRAAALLAQAADGLVEAHRAGIVHRDVKPSNIMIGDSDHAKLADFGIARSATDAALTRTGLVTGSPAYLAPEVASGSNATAASDVWSLGATLHHALAGRAPYDMGQNVLGGLYRIVHDDPPRLPADHPLAELLAGTMQKDPSARWPVVRVRDELRRVASGADAERSSQDRDATVALGTVSASVATADTDTTGEPTPPVRPVPTPAAARAASRTSGSSWGRIAAVLLLVLLVGLGAWLWWPEDGGSDTPAPADRGQSEEPQPSEDASPAEPTNEPTNEPTSEPSAEPSVEPPSEPTSEPTSDAPVPEDDVAAVQAFVDDYFSRVTSDPESTFELLTPEFQTASGGFGRYSGFWSTISSADASDIRVDTDTLTASFTVEYVTTSGRTTTQQGQLLIERDGDGYLIAGEG